jgi:catalase
MAETKKLTNNVGVPVTDNQIVLTAGPRGPMLLQDIWFLEKLAHFFLWRCLAVSTWGESPSDPG